MDFAQVNTLISVEERSFLTRQDLLDLLDAPDTESMFHILQDTKYHMSREDLEDPVRTEERLMHHLVSGYQMAFKNSPDPRVPEIFAVHYMYHNFKVLMKEQALRLDLDHLLIPIGRYPVQELRHAVQTYESSVLPVYFLGKIEETFISYEEYQTVEAIDVGIDMLQFDHLRWNEGGLQNPDVTVVVDCLIDFYNFITVMRAVRQEKPNSFIIEMASDKGTLPIRRVIELVRQNRLEDWFQDFNQLPYDVSLRPYLSKMQDGSLTVRDLEQLQELYLHLLLEEMRFSHHGAGPLLRFLNGVESEIKNLRLIIVGRANQLSRDQILERMKPIYGEKL